MESLAPLLRKDGFTVDWAQDGLVALSLFDQSRPELVVVTSDVPRLNASEVCQALRRRGSVPILALAEDEAAAARVVDAGADACVTTPCTSSVLHQQVLDLTGRPGLRSVDDRTVALADPTATSASGVGRDVAGLRRRRSIRQALRGRTRSS